LSFYLILLQGFSALVFLCWRRRLTLGNWVTYQIASLAVGSSTFAALLFLSRIYPVAACPGYHDAVYTRLFGMLALSFLVSQLAGGIACRFREVIRGPFYPRPEPSRTL